VYLRNFFLVLVKSKNCIFQLVGSREKLVFFTTVANVLLQDMFVIYDSRAILLQDMINI
jgi:hypothetical protein